MADVLMNNKNVEDAVIDSGKKLDKFIDFAVKDVCPYTPVNNQISMKIAHSFPTPDGYRRRGEPGNNDMSVAMFVKDEEDTILEVLEAILPITKEYVILIDETSSDETEDIVRNFADKNKGVSFIISYFSWQNDFSKARNAAIDLCMCSWILILDGHDVVVKDGLATIIDCMNMFHDDVYVVDFMIFMSPDPVYNIPSIFFPQPRLLRNKKEIRYESAVHNHLNVKAVNKVIIPDVKILHKRSAEKNKVRSEQRNKMGVEYFNKRLKDDPNDHRAMFYMGNIQMEDAQDYEKAAEYYELYINQDDDQPFKDERSQVYINLCRCYYMLEKKKLVLETATRGIGEGLNRRELWLICGQFYFEHKDMTTAISFFFMATKLPLPLCQLFLSGPVYSYEPWNLLAQAYINKGNYGQARTCFVKQFFFKPGDKTLVNNIRACEAKLGIEETAKDGINVIVADKIKSFSGPFVEKLAEKNNVRMTPKFTPDLGYIADMIFCEWADENAVWATEQQFNAPVVIRCHRYEIFQPMFQRINWLNVSTLIFVSEYWKSLALEMHNDLLQPLEDAGQIVINPVAVDERDWDMLPEYNDNKILFIGGVRHIKNYQMIFELAAMNPLLEFHHIGSFDHADLKPFFEARLTKAKNVIMHGRVEPKDMEAKVHEIAPGFVANTSMSESLGVGIIECMMMGIIPIVYDYPGAISALGLDDVYKYEYVSQFKKVRSELHIEYHCDSASVSLDWRKGLRDETIRKFGAERLLDEMCNIVMNTYDKWYTEKDSRPKQDFLKPAMEIVERMTDV